MENLMLVAGLLLSVAGLISGAAETGALGVHADRLPADAARVTKATLVDRATPDTATQEAVKDVGAVLKPDVLKRLTPDAGSQVLAKHAGTLTVVLEDGDATARARAVGMGVGGTQHGRSRILGSGDPAWTYTQAIAILVVPIKAEAQ